ncbi:MAG: protoporphyrinogen oxidase, partial [Gemmatimonadales bacterium]
MRGAVLGVVRGVVRGLVHGLVRCAGPILPFLRPVFSVFSSSPSIHDPSHVIGILGAGITGLSLSVFLEEAGVEHRVFEAASRPGGVIRSGRVDGRVLDWGPQRTRVTPPVERMIELLELGDRMVRVPADLPLYVLRRGRIRRVPFRPRDLFRTSLLSWRGKLRLFAEPWTGAYEDDETVGAFLSRKFGAEAYENLMGPLFGGLYGSDPGEMLVRHSLAETMEGFGVSKSILWGFLRGSFNRSAAPQATSFVEGMAEFTDAMHRRVEHRVSLETPIVGLAPGEGGGWTLTTATGETHQMDQVVLTVPSEVAAELLEEVSPDAARRLAGLRYNQLAMVHLAHEDADSGSLHGLGYQVSYGEGSRTRGVTWNSSALGRRGVLTAFLGGARDPALLQMDDDEIGEIARREFRDVMGVDTRILDVSRTRVPSWDRSWTAMEELELPAGLHLCSNYESRVGIPGRLGRAQGLAAQLAGEAGVDGAGA